MAMIELFSIFDSSNIFGSAGFVIRTYKSHLENEIRFNWVAPPYATIDVNPLEIDNCLSAITIENGLGQIRGGNWDDVDEMEQLDEHSIYRGLRQRFVEGKDWEETDRFKYMERKMKCHGTFNNYNSVEQFLNVRCEYVDELFASIRDEGYRPNFEEGHWVPDIDVRNNQYRFFHRLEPLIAIGREGDIYWIDGFHRVTIANLLGITSIPVHVLCRHEEWQRFRDTLLKSGKVGSSVDLSHPDLHAL